MSDDNPAAPSPISRRNLLITGALGALAAPLGAAAALSLREAPADPLAGLHEICRTAPTAVTGPDGDPVKIKLAWNASAICAAVAPVAQETGVFASHGLDVEFVTFGGPTETLEAIATGKADAGIGMALPWLKPLEQGFDAKITAGVHGGCLRLLAGKESGIASLADLKGKTVAISDQASTAKNFFSIALAKAGLNPESDVEWRQYPGELLPLAIRKGEVQALADSDPNTFIWLKQHDLAEVATDLTGDHKDRTSFLLAVRGSLIRDARPVAAAVTRAIVVAGHLVAQDPRLAAQAYANSGGQGSVEDLAAILTTQDDQRRPIGEDLKKQIALYGDELKLVNVLKARTNTAKLAERVYADVLTSA